MGNWLTLDVITTDGRNASIGYRGSCAGQATIRLDVWVEGVEGDHVLAIGRDVLAMGDGLAICMPGEAWLEGAAARRVADLVRAAEGE